MPAGMVQAARLVANVAAVVLIVACSKGDEPRQPQLPAAAEFAGSSSCRECHGAEYEQWLGSHHELAMALASEDTVLGDFVDTEFSYFGERTLFLRDGARFLVRTSDASGEVRDFAVTHTFGVEPLQQYLVEIDGGRLQALPFAWDARPEEQGGQRWFHIYPDEHIAPGDDLYWAGPQQNWNYMCAECHSTDVRMGYDPATDSFKTSYSEISVGCEACHGPGSVHVAEAEQQAFRNSRLGLVVDLDDQGRAVWSMNLATGIAERSEPKMQLTKQPEACGRCHSRRGVLTGDYEYGRPLADTHRLALLDEELYFADGQIKDEVFVYGSFLQSRMYRAGVSCSDCHNPHSLQLVTGDAPNAVCGQCHLPTQFATSQHSGHEAEDAGCIDCHMPSRAYMVVDDRRDHSFRVPRPDLSDATGVPNACNGCHADKSAAWAAAAIVERHGSERRPEFASALHAGRTGLANERLRGAFADSAHPGIARATALSLLAPPFDRPDAEAVHAGLRDADPLLRMAALRVHRFMPPEFRLQTGYELLADAIRGVRMDAVIAYAELRDSLPSAAREDFRRAVDEYRNAQHALLNRPEARVALGDLDMMLGNVDDALASYEQALRLDPASALARVNLADALRREGDDERGREVLEEGIRLAPDAAALRHSLGLLLVRIGQREDALAELREAVRLEPENRRYAYVLGIAESELGDAVDN